MKRNQNNKLDNNTKYIGLNDSSFEVVKSYNYLSRIINYNFMDNEDLLHKLNKFYIAFNST